MSSTDLSFVARSPADLRTVDRAATRADRAVTAELPISLDKGVPENSVAETNSGEESLRQIIHSGRVQAALAWLAECGPGRIADELAGMGAADAGIVFLLLDKERAQAVFRELEPADKRKVLVGMRDNSFRDLIAGIDPGNRACMLRAAPATAVKQVLSGSSPRDRWTTVADRLSGRFGRKR